MQASVKGLIEKGLIQSAHDCSDGGLFVALVESGMHRSLGFDINSDANVRKDAFLFGEGQSRVVVSVSLDKEEEFVNYMMDAKAEFSMLGVVIGKDVVVDEDSLGSIDEMKKMYDSALVTILGE